ncbi:MAG: DinB family protein [Planctomycetes bacterium]|jgi:hypothetical protein|nr:DinB family protein [Planctomycetota bacterium]
MLGAKDLLDAMLFECDICLHLFGKLPEGGLDYRPSPAQRDTRDLLRYLSFCGHGFAAALIGGDWEPYTAAAKSSETLAPEDFPRAMAEQKEKLREVFATITDEDLSERRVDLPWQAAVPLGRALLLLAYRGLSGYRMQLFLYAKAAGNTSISTSNCWAGFDTPPQP